MVGRLHEAYAACISVGRLPLTPSELSGCRNFFVKTAVGKLVCHQFRAETVNAELALVDVLKPHRAVIFVARREMAMAVFDDDPKLYNARCFNNACYRVPGDILHRMQPSQG